MNCCASRSSDTTVKPSLPGSITSRTTRSKRSRRDEQLLERRFAGLDDLGLVAFGFEVESQSFGEVLLVLDDEHALLAVRSRLGGLWQQQREGAAASLTLALRKRTAAVLLAPPIAR